MFDGSGTNNSAAKILICSCVRLKSPDIFFRFGVLKFTGSNQPYPQPPSEKTGGFDFVVSPLPYKGGKRASYPRTLLRMKNKEHFSLKT